MTILGVGVEEVRAILSGDIINIWVFPDEDVEKNGIPAGNRTGVVFQTDDGRQ